MSFRRFETSVSEIREPATKWHGVIYQTEGILKYAYAKPKSSHTINWYHKEIRCRKWENTKKTLFKNHW
jgi:hypothetical protein